MSDFLPAPGEKGDNPRWARSSAGLPSKGDGVTGTTRRAPVGVILAAGEGARLGVGLKPLARVGGVTLLERSIATLRRAGVERIVVVAGHEKDTLKRFVARKGLDVEVADNDGFAVGNGSSALVGGRAAGGRFVLVMVDHVFDPDELHRILESDAPFVAAVDTAPRHCDVDEATKMRLDGDCVVAVGKTLERWDAVDAGLFVCDASVLAAAERCLAEGEGTWNAVKRRVLAEGEGIVAVDLRGAFWLDVDTPEERRRAERLLVARAAGKTWDGAVSRWVNRPLSRPLTRALIRTGISPNGATLLAFALGIAGAGALATGALWPLGLVAGGLLVQLASVVDGVDGEIARASLRESSAGEFLDTVLDRVADAAIVAGLVLAAGAGRTALAVGGLALFGSVTVPFVKAAYHRSFGHALPSPATRIGAGRDLRLLLVALAAIFLQPLAGLVALAVVANAEAARRFVNGWQSARATRVRPPRALPATVPRREASTDIAPVSAPARAMTARRPE